MSSQSDTYKKIFEMVKKIPKGRVTTYGQIAHLAGLGRHARMVGYALHTCRDQSVPWHRVINAKGEVSQLPDPDSRLRQRDLLEAEGIVFNDSGKVLLSQYQWNLKISKKVEE